MSVTRKLVPYVASALTSPRTRDVRRGIHELSRRLRGKPHRVQYFHQTDDPYSHLAAQTLERLSERYQIELCPHLVGPPPDSAAPERERLKAYARKDAADVAPHVGLDLPRRAQAPDSGLVTRANRILTAALERDVFAEAAPAVGAALWAGDVSAIERAGERFGEASAEATALALSAGDAERARRGHYLGAMFRYAGEWFWGTDRLHYLEARLATLGLRRGSGDRLVLPAAADDTKLSAPGRLQLDFFHSARSPYSYIALNPTFELARRLPVDVIVRPVLPMVMRGLAVPRVKRFYILMDAKREADRLGVPFGHVCDPVGRPIERVYSLVPFAREQGRAEALLCEFARSAWAEGVETGTDAGMQLVIERAGISFEAARAHLDSDGWRAEVEDNRRELLDLGLWGVPSYRLRGRAGEPDFTTWGQDRLWLLEAEIRRRLA